MGQPVDYHKWPIFLTLREEIDDLHKLIHAEIRRVNEENARLSARLDLMDQARKRDIQGVEARCTPYRRG